MSTEVTTGIQALARGCCGCGEPALYYEAALEILTFFASAERDWTWVYAEKHRYLAINALDHLGLLEHGSGICGSWLTKHGEQALAFLRENGTDPEQWPAGSTD